MNQTKALGRYKRYPAYKDSGVDWLGEIPADWDAPRLKFHVDVNPPTRHRAVEASFVPMEAVGEYGGLSLDRTIAVDDASSGYTVFLDNDVVVAKITPCFENGKGALATGLANGVALGTTELHVLRAPHQVDPRFLKYVTFSQPFRQLGEGQMYGAGGQKRISDSFISNYRMPLPPSDDQRQIARFLDCETAKLDALVQKKERLIDNLTLRAEALVAVAVAKGVAHSRRVKRTASTVWSEIPEHWKLTRLRHLLQRVVRPVDVLHGVFYQEIGIRSWGRGLFHKDPALGAHLEEKAVYRVEPGDFVLNIVFAWEGAVAAVTEAESGMVASHRFPTFRCDPSLSLEYLLMVLNTEPGRALMEINSPGAAGRNRTIRMGKFLSEEIPLPPRKEQDQIVATMREDSETIANLSEQTKTAIMKLRELRLGLITAAVTGQIDVREEVA
ncbi:MAG: restriction endonuclease subunit S [Acidobacteria bacterium]|nr:restriction endonuclease subunit S [Acidobacteriota bacterium]